MKVFCIELDYDFMDNSFINYLTEGFKKLQEELSILIDVDIELYGEFEVETNKSVTYKLVVEEVKRKFAERTEWVFTYLHLSKLLSVAIACYVFYSVHRFRVKYLNDVEYQNRYLLKTLNDLDEVRTERGETSVFPLNYSEERRFIVVTSLHITLYETIQVIRGVITLCFPLFYVSCIVFGDFLLYIILKATVTNTKDVVVDSPPVLSVNVGGEGFVTDWMNSITKTFVPLVNGFDVEFDECAPKPHLPDEERAIGLALLFVFCFLQDLIYPFAARTMHLIMEHYYPDETRQRMAWLLNDILRRRRTMFTMIAERLSTQYSEDNSDPVPFFVWIRSELGDFWICRWIMKGDKEVFCLNCGKSLAKEKPNEGYFKCPTLECSGIYCRQCITQLQWVCILCKKDIKAQTERLWAGVV